MSTGSQEFEVTIKEVADYPLVIGYHLEDRIAAALHTEGKRVVVISDSTVGEKWGADVRTRLGERGISAELFTFPAGEQNKTQENVTRLQNFLLQNHYGRDSIIVALGGGVAGDLAGYVAATYMRGIPYINVPTTLLAMVDSSVGGKVGVDTPYGKNTIGAFWQPRGVFADLRFLQGLPKKEFISGLLEAVKTFITSDKSALALVEKLDLDAPLGTRDVLQEIVARSVRFKAGVASRDEREENERRILNFGHTVGHAIELLSGFSMPHGYAVGYGMLVEAKISELMGILPAEACAELFALLRRFDIEPAGLKPYAIDKVLEAMKTDKKSRGGVAYCVLLQSIGSVLIKDGQYAHPVEEVVVQRAYESLL